MQADAAVVSNALSRESQRARLTVSVKVVREPSEDSPFAAWEMPITITGSSEAIRVRMAATTRFIKVGTPAPSVDNETWTNADWTNAGVVSIGEQNRSLRTDFSVSKNQASQYAAGVLQGVLMVRVEYCDVFLRRHHVTACATRSVNPLPIGGVNYCGIVVDSNTSTDVDAECRD